MAKPGIDQLLIASALDPDLCRRLRETPDAVFPDYALTVEAQDLLRAPDHRLLPLLGAALTRQSEAVTPPAAEPAAPTESPAKTLPDMTLVLTVVPCAQYENGQLRGFSYAVWTNPLPAGADPATLPPPPGATLPGQPLPPLHAVIQLSALQLRDSAGNPVVGLSAALRQSSNLSSPPPAETGGIPDAPPFGSDLASEPVQAAVTAVRNAPGEQRYDRIIDLLRVLKTGDVR